MVSWHRLFGLMLTDLFSGSPLVVELEKDLSARKQLLDEALVRKEGGEFQGRLPDGLDNLAEHNLLSYKSLREALDDWAMDELIGHYVNYRKQASPSSGELLSSDQFRLYAISTRFPQKLAGQAALEPVQPGVYEVQWGSRRVRVLVLSQMPEDEHNAIWLLFSGRREKVIAAATQYPIHSGDTSTIINQLFECYQLEGIPMPYTLEDFRRDFTRDQLDLLPPEEILRRFTAEQRLEGLSPEEIRAFLERQEKPRKKRRGH